MRVFGSIPMRSSVDVPGLPLTTGARRWRSTTAIFCRIIFTTTGHRLVGRRCSGCSAKPPSNWRSIEREAGDYPTAIRVIAPLLTRDPTDETAHRELMRLYALSGQRHEALRQYQRCVDALNDELDVSPDAATEALYAQILNGTLSAPESPPSE